MLKKNLRKKLKRLNRVGWGGMLASPHPTMFNFFQWDTDENYFEQMRRSWDESDLSQIHYAVIPKL